MCGDSLQKLTSNYFTSGTHSVETSKTLENINEERFSEIFAIRAFHSSVIHPQPLFFYEENKNNLVDPSFEQVLNSGEKIVQNIFLYDQEGKIVFQPIN